MRIRTIKPEFWMHEGLCKCSEFSRLLAIALLNWSDDEGYFMANPILIRGQVFPFEDDSKKVPRSLQELSSVGWIRVGKDDQNRDVGMVINFSKHQRVDKPKPSSIKACSTFQDESKNDPRPIQDASKEERKGKEHGKEWEGAEEKKIALTLALPEVQSNGRRFPDHSETITRINGLRPEWGKPSQWTGADLHSLHDALGQLAELTDEDWKGLKSYFAAYLDKAAGYWQPKNRGQFVSSFPDVFASYTRWATKGGRPVNRPFNPTGK
jgi:hypothetical protein